MWTSYHRPSLDLDYGDSQRMADPENLSWSWYKNIYEVLKNQRKFLKILTGQCIKYTLIFKNSWGF